MQMQSFVNILALLLVVPCIIPPTTADTDPDKLTKMAETLKILQSLDKYYGQVARPRFGKRGDFPRLERLEEALRCCGSCGLAENDENIDGKPWDPLLR